MRPSAFHIGMGGGGWRNPYVTDGLVAMWDGEWNAGRGRHDPNATTWKDLVGSADMTMNTSTFTGWEWTGNAVSIDESEIGYQVAVTNNAALMGLLNNASAFTLEMFAVKDGTGTAYADRYVRTDGNTILVMSYRTNRVIGFYSNGNQNYVLASNINILSPFLASCVQTPTSKQLYFNGVLAAEELSAFGDVAWRNFWLASQAGAPRRIFCVRLYNRALSAAEVAANYAADQARFNLV